MQSWKYFRYRFCVVVRKVLYLVEQVGARQLQRRFVLKELVLANEARGFVFEVGDGAVEA